MKTDEIEIGKWYAYKTFTNALVLDVGTYDVYSWNHGHDVTVSGVTLRLGRQWYQHSGNVQKRRVIILTVNGRGASLASVMASTLTSRLDDTQVKTTLADIYANTEIAEIQSRTHNRTSDYQQALTGVLTQIAGTQRSGYYYNNIRSTLLNNDDVVDQMVMLWLRYHQQCGKDVNGEEDVESLVDTYRDAVRGLKTVSAQINTDDLKQQALEKVEAEWNDRLEIKEVTS